MKLPAIQWLPPEPLNPLPWSRYQLRAWFPVGARVEIKRCWWVDFTRGVHYEDRIRGTIASYWKGDTSYGITVACDDGKDYRTLPQNGHAEIVDDDAPVMPANGSASQWRRNIEPSQLSLFEVAL